MNEGATQYVFLNAWLSIRYPNEKRLYHTFDTTSFYKICLPAIGWNTILPHKIQLRLLWQLAH
ncbi:hypothetical protein SAMN05518672_102484 [Chitinophaga sp. CF118]|nr:hypothetical protein SAMN05518672_102484 [Chitinophaga sp. CF118]